jgi:hypothetical protein
VAISPGGSAALRQSPKWRADTVPAYAAAMWMLLWLTVQVGEPVVPASPTPAPSPSPSASPDVAGDGQGGVGSAGVAAGPTADDPHVIAFVKTIDDTRSSMESKVTRAIESALVSNESITPAATEDVLAAAQQAGIARKRLLQPGALAPVAEALDIDYLLWASVTRKGQRYEVALTAIDRTATTTVTTARIELAADGRGRGATMTAADGSQLLARILEQLPARAGSPTPATTSTESNQTGADTNTSTGTGTGTGTGDGFDTDWATTTTGSAAVQELINVLAPTLRGGLLVDSFVYPADLVRTVDPQRVGSRQQIDARLGVTVGRSEQAAGFVQLLMRRDFADPTRARLEAEFAVAQFEFAGIRLRGGRDKLTWGKTDLINVVDVLPIFDYRDVLDIEKFPTWFASASTTFGPITLEAYVLPVPEAHLLPAIDSIAVDGTMRGRNRWVKGRFRDVDETDGIAQNDYQAAAVPVQVRLRDNGPPVPSVTSLQPAARIKLAVGGIDASVAYAYLYDRFPTVRLPVVGRDPLSRPSLNLTIEPTYLRKHWVTADVEMAFDSIRIAAEAAFAATEDFDALFDINNNDHEVEDPTVAGVLGVDYRTPTFFDDQAMHFFLNLTATVPLTSSVKINDAVMRLRYPIPAGALLRVEYLAGEDAKIEFNAVDSWGPMQLFNDDADVVKELLEGHDVWLGLAGQMQFFDVVTARVEGAWLFGNPRGIFARFPENSRVGGSLGVSF